MPFAMALPTNVMLLAAEIPCDKIWLANEKRKALAIAVAMPWCTQVGEIVTARRAEVATTKLLTPSFLAPTDEQCANPEVQSSRFVYPYLEF